MDEPLQLQADDIIAALTQQRNAAMDEITRQAAIIRALQKKLNPPLEKDLSPD
jgi:hypothetical protein